MIIKGKSRSGPEVLGPYLTNTERNERAQINEIKGTIARDLVGALTEMDAYAEGTKCQKPLYHAQINPEPPNRLTPEQINEAVDALEKKLGFEGHARVVVIHEKKDREHIHVVWSRIDLEKMRAVPDSNNYRKHEEVARDLERRFGHDRVQGAHAERDGAERPDRTLSRSELRQQERTGILAKDVKQDVTDAFSKSENAETFAKALEDKGYILAKGDRRDFVVVDREGGIHSLAKRIEGMRVARLRDFMAPLDRSQLPDVERAKDMQFDRQHGLPAEQAFVRWEERTGDKAINQARKEDQHAQDGDAPHKKQRKDNSVDKAYSHGEDYVSQTQAALKDHKRRQKKLDRKEEERLKDERTKRETEEAELHDAHDDGSSKGSELDKIELTDAQRTRIDQILQDADDRKRTREERSTQRAAPGRGQPRGR